MSEPTEILLNGKPLKQNTYKALKEYAVSLQVNLKNLKNMNENNLIKAIKEKLSVVSYDQLPADVSMAFRINYAHHFGASKEELMEKLGITRKKWVDVTWLYANAGYKQKIMDYLEKQKALKAVNS